MTKEKDGLSIEKHLIIMICVVVAFGAFGVYLKYQVETSIDWNKVHQQLTTNETLTKSISCNDLYTMKAASEWTFFVNTKQVKQDVTKIMQEHGC